MTENNSTARAKRSGNELTLDRVLKGFADAFAPIVVVVLLCDVFGVSSLVRLIVTGVVFLLLLFFMWFVRADKRFATILNKPRVLAFAMWVMLAVFGLSIFLLLRTPVVRPDPWVAWEASLDSKSRACKGDEECLKRVLREAAELEPVSKSPPDALLADLRAGQAVRQLPTFASVLREIGISDRFLGTGLSLSQSAQSYDKARLPEYLVPNYPETDPQVLVWRISTLEEGMPLRFLIENRQPIVNGASVTDANRIRNFLQVVKKHLNLDSPTPAVVRFAELPEGRYSGCLGPRGRSKVFASQLGMAWKLNLSVGETADLSGYELYEHPSNKIYVFVFVPSHPNEITSPTWTNIFAGKATTQTVLCPPRLTSRQYVP